LKQTFQPIFIFKHFFTLKKKNFLFQDAELPQFTIMGWETNERKIKLATGTYQVNPHTSGINHSNNYKFHNQFWLKN
jgi:hypothetical protein